MDDGTPTWNRDARSRAQTRAVLMALARKRDWYFHASVPWTVIWCILSLGTFPLLLQAYRFDRFRRLEWNQYHAFAEWLVGVSHEPTAGELKRFAQSAATRPSSRFAVRMFAIGSLAIAAVVFYRTIDPVILLKTAFYPQSLLWPAIAYSAVLSLGWFAHLLTVMRHQTMTRLWLGRLNELFAKHDKRPVPATIARASWPALGSASLAALFGPTWAAAMIVAIDIQNRYTNGTRAVRLAMVERMLEWMDNSGLPVEFDVEEIEPDELLSAVA